MRPWDPVRILYPEFLVHANHGHDHLHHPRHPHQALKRWPPIITRPSRDSATSLAGLVRKPPHHHTALAGKVQPLRAASFDLTQHGDLVCYRCPRATTAHTSACLDPIYAHLAACPATPPYAFIFRLLQLLHLGLVPIVHAPC